MNTIFNFIKGDRILNLLELFRKQGGFSLIKQFFHGGVLGTAMYEFLLLGKSRTALEILRLSVTLKIKQKLEKSTDGHLKILIELLKHR